MAAAAFALVAGCGDDDGGTTPPAEEGGEAGETSSSGGKQSVGAAGGSGGSTPVGQAGEVNPPAGGEGGDAPVASEVGWSKRFALPGLNGNVDGRVSSAILTGARKLWVGGKFALAGDVPAKNVAVWNGQRWSALGDGLPTSVQRLAATSDENVYALVEAREDVGAIHFWDGEAWTEVEAETDGLISDIAVGADDTLYAVGSFTTIDGVTAPGVASWTAADGWKALPYDADVWGNNGFDNLAPVGDSICLGGRAGETGGAAACLVDGAWVSYRANIAFGGVNTFKQVDGTLYVGGDFMLEGFDQAGGLAKWTGEAWELIGGGVAGQFGQPTVTDIAIDGDRVYATGFIALAGGAFAQNMAMYDGERWNDLNGGLSSSLGAFIPESPRGSTLAVDDGGIVYVGGMLTLAGAESALRLATWDGVDWHSVDDPQATRLGANGNVGSIVPATDGSLYVSGSFQYLSNQVQARGVARFVPAESRWIPLGPGLSGTVDRPGSVRTLAEHAGSIYAAGDFTVSGTASVKGVARWDGAAWRTVGGGIDGNVRSLLSGPDDKLYAAGVFALVGGAPARNAAVWDGKKWTALGSIGEEWETVYALTADTDGALYAGGDFTTATGAPVNHIAVWKDDAWTQLGEGLDGAVASMTWYDGKLVLGGSFSSSGEAEVPKLAYWDADSSTFEPVGGGIVPAEEFGFVTVSAVAARGKDLYVAGIFDAVGGQKVSNIARFDGEKWHDVDGGVDDVAEALSFTDDALWVGGTFARAGAYGSVGIARYGFAP